MSSINELDFNIPSIDDITHDIDDDVLNAILEDELIGSESLDQTLDKFDGVFLDSLKDCNDLDDSNSIIEPLNSTIFDYTEEDILSGIADDLHGVDGSFDPLNMEPISVDDVELLPVSSSALTREQQIQSINQYSKNLRSTFQALQKKSKEKLVKKVEPMIPVSSEYRDLSNMTDEQVRLKYKSMVGRSQDPFPVKLHKIINLIERDGLSSVISWTSHGRAFKVHDNDRFIKEIMSKYFYQTKMSSFTRQLGMYGFQKLIRKDNPDRGAYFHELFLRGRPGLAQGILRLKHKSLLDPNNEPNLELSPPMPPNPVGPDNAAKQAAVSVKTNYFPRAVHYGVTANPSPQIAAGLRAQGVHNNVTVPYAIPSNIAGNMAVLPNASMMPAHHSVIQETKPDLNNVPLLERIKQKRKAQNSNQNTTSGQGLIQYVTNSSQLKPSTPISYFMMRVGHF